MHQTPIDTGSAASSHNHKPFRLLLTPSWLSGAGCVVIGLLVSSVAATQATFLANWHSVGGGTRLDFARWTNPIKPTLQHHIETAMLFGFWFLTGVVVYLFLASLYNAIYQARTFEHELDYVHANRRQLLKTAAWHLAVRIVTICLWLAVAYLFANVVVPYAITVAHAASTHLLSIKAVGLILLASALTSTGIHIQVIFLRLLFLRPRVFHNEEYQ